MCAREKPSPHGITYAYSCDSVRRFHARTLGGNGARGQGKSWFSKRGKGKARSRGLCYLLEALQGEVDDEREVHPSRG